MWDSCCHCQKSSNAACKLVDRNTGFVVDLDAREISDSIQKIITDDTLRNKMSKSALTIARNLTGTKKPYSF